jgi:hypothetical protein
MAIMIRTGVAAALLAAAVGVMGCRSTCDRDTVDRAAAILEANQSCETDADCRVVSDFCEELPGGWCGQLVMNRQGTESAEWKAVSAELKDCGPSECTQCLGALVPTCSNGSCGSPASGF